MNKVEIIGLVLLITGLLTLIIELISFGSAPITNIITILSIIFMAIGGFFLIFGIVLPED